MQPSRLGTQIDHRVSVRARPDAVLLVYVALITLVAAGGFLYGLGAYPIRDINEGLYAEIAREMLATGNFVVPHLNGVPYIEKPPLLYWLMALSFELFGQSAGSARLVPALPAFLLSIYLFYFCRRLGAMRAGFYAALIFATSFPVLLLSRTVLFDSLLSATLAGCLLAFLQWYLTRARKFLLLSSVMLALALLDKGGVALVLAGGVIGSFLFMQRDIKAARALFDPLAIGLFVVIAVPWHVMAALQQDGFAWFYLVNEHLLRFGGAREPFDYQTGPIYYYLPRLLVLVFPWTPLLVLLCRPALFQKPAPDSDHHDAAIAKRLCAAWVLFPLLFFSLSAAKAQYYILVIAPPLALLLGLALASSLRRGAERTVGQVLGWAAALCAGALMAAAHPHLLDHPDWRDWMLLPGGALLCAAAGYGAYRVSCASRGGDALRDGVLAAIAVMVLPLMAMVLQIADQRAMDDSSEALARAIQRRAGPETTIFLYRNFEDDFSSLPYHLGRTVKIIDSDSADLKFGCDITAGTPDTPCVSPAVFNDFRARSPSMLVVHNDQMEDFLATSLSQAFPTFELVGEKWLFYQP
jgi:4-amino-4-deoxy-L-arabinose transferase-like glycosyltransferase